MRGISRPFTRLPEAVNFGPTGARLWATYLIQSPGMEGSFEFIHKVNIPRLYGLGILADERTVDLRPQAHKWYPSRLEASFMGDGIELSETKFITWDDAAVDLITVTNRRPECVSIDVGLVHGADRNGSGHGPDWRFTSHGATCYVHCSMTGHRPRRLAPGESAEWVAAAAIEMSPGDAIDVAERWTRLNDPLGEHESEYARYFRGAPEFTCSDPYVKAMWDYRWYVNRRNLANPRCGRLPYPLFYEGRGAKMTLAPWNPQGWEFSKLIPFGTGLHLLEGRWNRDASACKGEILNLVHNQGDDGLFRCAYIDSTGGDYTDFSAWSAWQLYLVHPDREWLSQVAPGLARQVKGTLHVYDPDGDYLPVVLNHGKTGKEYQPSFFHRLNYPDNPPKELATPLERVDAACYLHMNASAVSSIWAELGEPTLADRFAQIAAGTRDSVLAKMWEPGEQFFYDLDAEDHSRVPVENVVGFDPFLAGIAGPEHLRVFDRLRDPEQFGSAYPLPSVSRRSRAFAPDASWNGVHLKGPHGCMWNGPTWPFTNSTVLMALANATAMCGGKLNEAFAELFSRYTRMCFRSSDPSDPIIYEHYNPDTGEPISQEEDYFHSSWIDLVIGRVAGITPLPQGQITFAPIDCGIDEYHLRGVNVAGRTVDVDFDLRSGYEARIDGRPIDAPLG